MTLMHPSVSGYVLAGGMSRRLGVDKRFLTIGGQTFLQRICQLLEDALGEAPTLVGDNLPPALSKGHRILTDARPGCGPLGGLVAALNDCPTRWALIMPTDLPLLTRSDLEGLLCARRDHCQVLTLSSDGSLQPLAALYDSRTAPFWQEQLARGEFKLKLGILQLTWDVVRVSDNASLFNVNTPEEAGKFH
jgi:molybdopterin-guanine dinucleotide biosynthesis protein A